MPARHHTRAGNQSEEWTDNEKQFPRVYSHPAFYFGKVDGEEIKFTLLQTPKLPGKTACPGLEIDGNVVFGAIADVFDDKWAFRHEIRRMLQEFMKLTSHVLLQDVRSCLATVSGTLEEVALKKDAPEVPAEVTTVYCRGVWLLDFLKEKNHTHLRNTLKEQLTELIEAQVAEGAYLDSSQAIADLRDSMCSSLCFPPQAVELCAARMNVPLAIWTRKGRSAEIEPYSAAACNASDARHLLFDGRQLEKLVIQGKRTTTTPPPPSPQTPAPPGPHTYADTTAPPSMETVRID